MQLNELINHREGEVRIFEEKNEALNDQIASLKSRAKVIKKRINETNFELRGNQKIVEIPCAHAEEINMLEVQLASKKNELLNMRKSN